MNAIKVSHNHNFRSAKYTTPQGEFDSCPDISLFDFLPSAISAVVPLLSSCLRRLEYRTSGVPPGASSYGLFVFSLLDGRNASKE